MSVLGRTMIGQRLLRLALILAALILPGSAIATALEDAAFAGNADAQNSLGMLHRDGDGVETDPIKAYAWFSLAAAQDHAAARTNLSRLRDELSSKEILGGQTMATDLHAKVTEQRLRALRQQLAAASQTIVADEPQTPAPLTIAQADPPAAPVIAPVVAEPRPLPEPVEVQPEETAAIPAVSPPPQVPVQVAAAPPTTAPPSDSVIAASQPSAPDPSPLASSDQTSTAAPALPASKPGYLVQLGLFRSAKGIRRLEQRLSERGFTHENRVVTIRGVEYSRIRVGPFSTRSLARDRATELDALFKLKSSVVTASAEERG